MDSRVMLMIHERQTVKNSSFQRQISLGNTNGFDAPGRSRAPAGRQIHRNFGARTRCPCSTSTGPLDLLHRSTRLDWIGGVSRGPAGAGLPALTRGRARASTHAAKSTTRTPARRVSPPGRPPLAWTIASRDLPPRATARGTGTCTGGQAGHLGRCGG